MYRTRAIHVGLLLWKCWVPCPEKTNTIGGRVFGASVGLLRFDDLGEPRMANDRHVMERARRPRVRASALCSLEEAAVMSRASPSSDAERGESAPAMRRVGTSTSPVQNDGREERSGGPCTTACPLAPPIPELVMAIKGKPSVERHRRGSGSRGTRRRN